MFWLLTSKGVSERYYLDKLCSKSGLYFTTRYYYLWETNDKVLLEIENGGLLIKRNDGVDYVVYDVTLRGEYSAEIAD